MLNSGGTTFTGLPFKTSLTAAIIVSLCIATRSIFLNSVSKHICKKKIINKNICL